MLCFILAQDSDQGCTAAAIGYDDHACSVIFGYVYFYETERYPSQSRILNRPDYIGEWIA
jgi:hypothetical protein